MAAKNKRGYHNIVEDTRRGERTYWWKQLRKGLKQVHIGDGVWLIGKESMVTDPNDPTKKTLHQVIYDNKNNKEYHIYGETVTSLHTTYLDEGNYGYDTTRLRNRHGNKTDQSKLKIYILTSILDDRKNWCFDLAHNKPNQGEMVKIIYDNGTVKNIEFSGKWEPFVKVKDQQFIQGAHGSYWASSYQHNPVAFRTN